MSLPISNWVRAVPTHQLSNARWNCANKSKQPRNRPTRQELPLRKWKPLLMPKPITEQWCVVNTPRHTPEQKDSQTKSNLRRRLFTGSARDVGVISYAKWSSVRILLLEFHLEHR